MLFFFFFNDTATTEIYTLSLHDALPILQDLLRPSDPVAQRVGVDAQLGGRAAHVAEVAQVGGHAGDHGGAVDRKSTRLNSSHANISYAVFCLKKKKN